MESDSSFAVPPADDSDSARDSDPARDPRLAPGGGPVHRLQSHAQGLADDVRAWLEMRFALAKIELYERVDEQLDQVLLYAIAGGLGAVGGLVLLLSACFGVSWAISALTGWTLGALFLGFLVVAGFFLLAAGLILAAEPRFGVLEEKTRAVIPERRVMEAPPSDQRAHSAERSSHGDSA